ncbi:MAG TPA: hypothetical protein VF765_24115 [Polyangiaceae bacterium]
MNEHEMRTDVQEEAFRAWDRDQRTKKRRLALVVALALVVGFAGAAVAGRSYRAQSQAPHAAKLAAR